MIHLLALNGLFVDSLEFFTCKIMSSVTYFFSNMDAFHFFFSPNCSGYNYGEQKSWQWASLSFLILGGKLSDSHH